MAKQRTITLTGRAPVTIDEATWPVIAQADERPGSMRNGTPVPDYETDRHTIRVRANSDGRAIVYAVLDGSTQWTGTRSRKGGEIVPAIQDPTRAAGVTMLDSAGVVMAIERVGDDCRILDSVVRDCVADLPAEELS